MKNLAVRLNRAIHDVLLFGWYTGLWGICLIALFFYAKTL